MLNVNVVTLHPEIFSENLKHLPIKRALEKGVLKVNLINLRDFALDNYGTVDDKPYGGGVGMVLMVEPIYKALETVLGTDFEKKVKAYDRPLGRVIATSPKGRVYNQALARELSKEQNITIICGRYEGIDSRVEEHLVTDVLSIGEYVLSGGEIPTMVFLESIARLLPGVLEKEEAAQIESFSKEDYVEYPQYTRPENFKGMEVPPTLLSGNHQEIEKWRFALTKRPEEIPPTKPIK